jgi:type II secretory pathway component PulF
MPTYAYTAVDATGQKTAGVAPGGSRAAVIDELAAKGLYPVRVEERVEGASVEKPSTRPGRVSAASVEAFIRELANLLRAGVPLSRALQILTREASQAAARKQWAAIHDDVAGGSSLADAMAKWPRSFPRVYVAMVRAGETGGFLDVVLEQIADFRSREQDLLGRVRSALVYPIVLSVLATVVLVFLLTYFIPRFSAIFAEFGGSLPWLTRAIVACSGAATHYGHIVIVAAVILFVLLRRALATGRGRRTWEKWMLGLPLIGRLVARFALVRFCRMLGTLLAAGVPLVTALKVAREAIGNQTLTDAVTRATEQVQRGAPLAASLAECPVLFPGSVVEMVAVAEQTGRLDKELQRLAANYEGELDRRLRMLVALLEPAFLFVMAAVVGTVVIGMLLPVFTLQELIR